MREIKAEAITQTIARLCQEANFELGEDVTGAPERARQAEESPLDLQPGAAGTMKVLLAVGVAHLACLRSREVAPLRGRYLV